jgi:hypothetical protein
VQTQGSLSHHSLASVLLDLQSKRATGALTVSAPSGSCSLYLLFGHLFHAAGDAGRGSEAVVTALSWRQGDFVFEPRASLPMEQTISATTEELVAEADRRSSPRPSPLTRAVERPPVAGGRDLPEPRRPVAGTGPATPTRATVSGAATPTAATEDVPWARRPAVPVTAGRAPAVERAGSHAPERLCPLPTGTPVCTGLSSSLVDVGKVLRTIEADRLTGYLALRGPGFAGVVTLDGGRVLGACFRDGAVTEHELGLEQLRRRMERGDGVLDVAELRPETVMALTQLLTSRPLLAGLRGRFVDFDQLLRYLAEERFDGGVAAQSGADIGVVLMCRGGFVGAYTSAQRELTQSTLAVHGLAAQPDARIEVKGRAGSPSAVDLAAPVHELI